MNNACPECGAVYAVGEKDIGRKISCKKCSTTLIVAEEGLKRADGEGASIVPKKDGTGERERIRDRDDEDRGGRRKERDEDEDRGSRRKVRDEDDDRGSRRKGRDDDDEESGRDRDRARPKRTGPGAAEQMMTKLKGLGDLATWLYGFGLFITIYGFFSSEIDRAKVSSREGDRIQAITEDTADERDTNAKNDGKPSEGDLKDREKRRKDFAKEKNRLDDKVSYAQAGLGQGLWWTQYFKLFGFALLAFGSIGYLKPEQGPFKRILGGVTILLILVQVVGGFQLASIHIAPGGRGG